MDMNDVAEKTGNPVGAHMPVDGSLDEDTRKFMADGYIMGSDCFGTGSKQYADRLMEFVGEEYSDYVYYKMLAHKPRAAATRQLFNEVAADELKDGKRFAAAYFLIVGKRYFPTRNSIEPVTVPKSYTQALRQRYLAESHDAVKYRMFAQNTQDECLKRIALSAGETEKRHAQMIMELIQGM